jgi:hypothetical protein
VGGFLGESERDSEAVTAALLTEHELCISWQPFLFSAAVAIGSVTKIIRYVSLAWFAISSLWRHYPMLRLENERAVVYLVFATSSLYCTAMRHQQRFIV